MKIVFFGTPEFVIPVLEVIQQNFDLVAVVTNPDKPTGRHQELTPSPVKLVAQKMTGAQILTPEKLDSDFTSLLKTLNPDLFVVAAFGQIIPEEILNLPKYGSLNIHPSILPKYRGASPIQAAILNGDSATGVTIIKMDERMDHGPIVAQSQEQILSDDTFESLSTKLFHQGAKLLKDNLQDFVDGKMKPILQDDSQATYTWKTDETKQKAYFEIDPPAGGPPSPEVLNRMARAFYPWPNAWTKWNGKVVKLLPGKMIQIEGKKPVKLEEFLRGYPEFPLKSL